MKVSVPSLKFDNYFKSHFRENEQFMVHDPEEKCESGDWVLIRELSAPLSLQVKHQVVKKVYENGNIIDPITGKKCVGLDFAEDIDFMSKRFGLKPLPERFGPPPEPAPDTTPEKGRRFK
jgi:small subunit ribosomal protein S17